MMRVCAPLAAALTVPPPGVARDTGLVGRNLPPVSPSGMGLQGDGSGRC